MYEIQKNFPAPMGIKKEGYGKYPFASMEVGDSFLVPHGEYDRNKINTACQWAMRKFSIRIVTKTEFGGLRIYRVN